MDDDYERTVEQPALKAEAMPAITLITKNVANFFAAKQSIELYNSVPFSTNVSQALFRVLLPVIQPNTELKNLFTSKLLAVDTGIWGDVVHKDPNEFFETHVFGRDFPSVLDNSFQLSSDTKFMSRFVSLISNQLNKSLDGKQLPLIANIEKFSKDINLSTVEQKLLTNFALCWARRPFRDVACAIALTSLAEAAEVLSKLIKEPAEDVLKCLKPSSALRSLNLVDTLQSNSITDLSDIMRVRPEIFIPLLDEHSDIGSALFPIASETQLLPEDFKHIEKESSQIIALLKSACKTKTKGVNILIYGPPGTGKSQLARVCASSASAILREVACADQVDGESLSSSGRYAALQIGQVFSNKAGNTVLLFDEAEDAFPTEATRLIGSGKQANGKAWVNNLLENNLVPVIWISNSISQIDPAYLRRFQFHLELKEPSAEARDLMVRKSLDGLNLADSQFSNLLARKSLAPGLLTSAAKFTKLVSAETGDDHGELISAWLDRADDAMGNKNKNDDSRSMPTTYNPDFLNLDTQFPVSKIINALKDRRQGTLCFYGSPGTGKTALAEHIAQSIGVPLMIRKASDLVSKYVGETEQNLAKMFEEAENSNSLLLLDEADSFMQDRRGAQRTWEVTEVNEMLQQMERFKGIFICTTNLLDRVDEAALRRFSFKVKFKPLTSEQRIRMFASECLGDINLIPNQTVLKVLAELDALTPGDFAVVRRQEILFNEKLAAEDFVKQLQAEHAAKPAQRESKKIGF